VLLFGERYGEPVSTAVWLRPRRSSASRVGTGSPWLVFVEKAIRPEERQSGSGPRWWSQAWTLRGRGKRGIDFVPGTKGRPL
jgi:hypothetical protein